MNDRLYHFSLRPMDFGQLIDGLCARRDAWAKTAQCFRGELKEPFFAVEECDGEEEAQEIADHYSEIIENLLAQADPQRKMKVPPLLERPPEDKTVNGWCLCSDFFFSGSEPVETEDGKLVVHATERDALAELAKVAIIRSAQFLRGECESLDLDGGIYVAPCSLHSDGSVTCENKRFTPPSPNTPAPSPHPNPRGDSGD